MKLYDKTSLWERRKSWEGRYRKNIIHVAETSDGGWYWYGGGFNSLNRTRESGSKTFHSKEAAAEDAVSYFDEQAKEAPNGH